VVYQLHGYQEGHAGYAGKCAVRDLLPVILVISPWHILLLLFDIWM
jgi:hypothetical protein